MCKVMFRSFIKINLHLWDVQTFCSLFLFRSNIYRVLSFDIRYTVRCCFFWYFLFAVSGGARQLPVKLIVVAVNYSVLLFTTGTVSVSGKTSSLSIQCLLPTNPGIYIDVVDGGDQYLFFGKSFWTCAFKCLETSSVFLSSDFIFAVIYCVPQSPLRGWFRVFSGAIFLRKSADLLIVISDYGYRSTINKCM